MEDYYMDLNPCTSNLTDGARAKVQDDVIVAVVVLVVVSDDDAAAACC